MFLLSNTGCPSDYRLGLSGILWTIGIIFIIILGMIFFYRGFRTFLKNRKELYFGVGFFGVGVGISYFFIQIGVYFQDFFLLYLSLAILITTLSLIPFVYYWEKNLINLRKIPTLYTIFLTLFALTNFFFVLFFKTLVFDTYILIFLILAAIAILFVVILASKFIMIVIGKLRNKGIMLLIGFCFYFLASFLDHPPGCSIVPFSTILSPFFLIISGITYSYGLIGIIDGLTNYYTQAQICAVHKGKISKGDRIFYCPSCNTLYCQSCYEQVIKKEGCWNCGYGILETEKKEWKSDELESERINVKFDKDKKQPKNFKK